MVACTKLLKMQLLCYKKKTSRSMVAFLSDPSADMEKEALRDGLTQWQLKIIQLPRSHSPEVAEPG